MYPYQEMAGSYPRQHPNVYWSAKLGWNPYFEKIVQIIGLDYSPDGPADPSFVRALKLWQSRQGDLKPDGVLGPKTWGKISRYVRYIPENKTGLNGLDIAKRLVTTRFNGWTYGFDASKKQIYCTKFVMAVVEEMNGGALPLSVQKDIQIAHTDVAQDIAGAIQKKDSRLGGVCYALQKYGMGKMLPLEETVPGDFIQYWYWSEKSSRWDGHAAVIDRVVNISSDLFKASIFGAHGSMGLGTLTTTLRKRNWPIFVGRFTTPIRF
jgi:hypothetical protein